MLSVYLPVMPLAEHEPPTPFKTNFQGTVSIMLFSTENQCLDYAKTRPGVTCHALDKEALVTQLDKCLCDGFTHILLDCTDHRRIKDYMQGL